VKVARTVVVSMTNSRSMVSALSAATGAAAMAEGEAAAGAPEPEPAGAAAGAVWLLPGAAGVGSGGGGKRVWYPKSTRNDKLIASRTLRSMCGGYRCGTGS
jgi:hypothetical protein